jgi:hypothetical protein
MPPRFYDLPPDHPLFTQGVSFVFRDELPDDAVDEAEDVVEEDNGTSAKMDAKIALSQPKNAHG